MVLGSSPVAVSSPSDFAPASSKEFLDIQATIECGFTLKRVRDMIRTYSGRDVIGLRNRILAFKNNSPFTKCISKINNVLIDNAEDLDVVIPMYNLLEYGKNYSKITGSFWNYYIDGPNNPPLNLPVGNNLPTVSYNADTIANSESFKYKSSIPRKTSNTN